VENCSLHGYADDLQIYLSRRTGLIEDLAIRINEDLKKINDWAAQNQLLLNPVKSCVLPISKFIIDFSSIPPLFIGDSQLQFVNKTVNLGFVLNSSLTCADHINSVVSKIYYTLRNLRRSADFTPQETKLCLVKQLIMPFISYAETVYPCLDAASMHKLQVAFNSATRYVFRLSRFDHVSRWNTKVLGCSLENHFKIRNCIFLHKIIQTKTPPYLFDKLRFAVSSRSANLIIPKYKYTVSERLFFVNAIRLWNSLPVSIRSISESGKFKTLVTAYFTN